jgi:ribokinase
MIRHYNVLTIGETTIDAFMKLAHASQSVHLDSGTGMLSFKHGDKIDVARYDFSLGGNATNVAVGLNRLGVKATLCSETGDDEFSIKIRNALARENIERVMVKQIPGPSSFAVILNYKGDRTVFVQDVQREHDVDYSEVEADIVYLTSMGREWQEPYKKAVEFAKEHNSKLVFNPGSRQIHEGSETVHFVLKHTHTLFINKEEGEHLLFGEKKVDSSNDKEYIQELMEKLQKLGPEIVVMTNGKNGSYSLDAQRHVHFQDLFPGEIVERTGAGDAFTSGFLASTINGGNVSEAMQWGAINASSVVGHIGAQDGLLTIEEMEELSK